MNAAAAVLGAALAIAAWFPQGAQTWVLVICGVGGDSEHRAAFDARARQLLDGASEHYGLAPERTIYLAERPAEVATTDRRSDAAGIAAAFADLAARSTAGDTVLVVLIGHGSGAQEGGRFNIPGPDVGPGDFEPWLAALSDRRIGFVNTTSASAGFQQLAGPGRVVVTATASLREREEPRFGEHFAAAFGAGVADVNRDGRISLGEAFNYATREVERFYDDAGRLQPEHALLADDGAAAAVRGPLDLGALGLAQSVGLGGVASADDVGADPELRALLSERAELEAQLDDLRARKESQAEDDYLDQLEALLVRIAEVDRAIRARESDA